MVQVSHKGCKSVVWGHIGVLEALSAELGKGNAILATTDTVPGLLSAVTHAGYVDLNRIKKRVGKAYLIVIGSFDQLNDFVALPVPEAVNTLMKQCWPGPLTIICKANKGLDPALRGPNDTVALRMPDHEPLRTLARACNGLFSTSANFSGDPVPDSLDMVDQGIAAQVAYQVADSSSATARQTCPSTIVDCTGKKPCIIREGAYELHYPKCKIS